MMVRLNLRLELLSDTLIGSGEGWGANINSDVVFDEFGLPLIPGRRIKGSLRESALEVIEMFEKSGMTRASRQDIDRLFGKTGKDRPGAISFSNCYLDDYLSNREWIKWLMKKYPKYFSKEIILHTFSLVRQQTAINADGTAKDNSLRSLRVLKKGLVFFGNMETSNTIEPDQLGLLSFAARNLRYLGTNRNRGFGYIGCSVLDEKNVLDGEYLNNLENSINEA
jgi:CRISPR/Cas system CSM-associated protein Csm3 (group 7 of RAMP superfamily)